MFHNPHLIILPLVAADDATLFFLYIFLCYDVLFILDGFWVDESREASERRVKLKLCFLLSALRGFSRTFPNLL